MRQERTASLLQLYLFSSTLNTHLASSLRTQLGRKLQQFSRILLRLKVSVKHGAVVGNEVSNQIR